MATTLTIEFPLPHARSEIVHTRINLEVYPYFPSDLAAFQTFEAGYEVLLKQSHILSDTVSKCKVHVKLANHDLNIVIEEVNHRVEDISDKNQRDSLRKQLMGNKTPSQFKKPALGAKLTAMDIWVSILAGQPFDSLKSYAPTVKASMEKAALAESAMNDARNAKNQFFAVGDYKIFIDSLNAARNELAGKAAAYKHANPGLNLPRDFEDLFFLPRERDEEPSAADLLEEAAALEERAAKLKTKAQAMLDEEQEKEKARAEAKLKEKLAAISAAEKEAAELLAKAAAMKAELPTS